ncbi:MAG: hypothetical protein KIS66_12680 [Fimbriimonadaceae bacterium]|nr:hypothetical protein [Fimbriimonadaceae bacterium]
MRPAILAFAAAVVIALGGCGGTAAQILGVNSDVFLAVESRDIDDLVLIVSPKQGSAGSSATCRTDAIGSNPVWCNAYLTADTNEIEFTTNSDASQRPYYAYVRNLSAATVRCTVAIAMEKSGDVTTDRWTFDVLPNETLHVYDIYRNNFGRRSF